MAMMMRVMMMMMMIREKLGLLAAKGVDYLYRIQVVHRECLVETW